MLSYEISSVLQLSIYLLVFFSFSVVCLVMFGMGDGVWSPNCSCSMSFLLTRQHAINVTVSTLYRSP